MSLEIVKIIISSLCLHEMFIIEYKSSFECYLYFMCLWGMIFIKLSDKKMGWDGSNDNPIFCLFFKTGFLVIRIFNNLTNFRICIRNYSDVLKFSLHLLPL